MNTNLKMITVVVVGVLLLGLSGVVAHAGGLVDTTFNSDNFPVSPVINDIDNQYWTLPAGTLFVYRTMPKVGDDGCEVNYVWVTDDTLVDIAEVTTREVQDWVYVDEDCDGEVDNDDYLSENTLDWYAQDDFGNVWYLGEYTEEYEYNDYGDLVNTFTEGSWTAGVDNAEPDIVMLAEPTPGDFYQQEYLEDEAEDVAKVLRVNARVNLTFDNEINPDEYEDCAKTKEWSPLELGVIEHKYYCDGMLLLVNELQGGTVRTELVALSQDQDRDDVSPPDFIYP